jgi:large subunit ribosomal protein L21
MDAYAVVETGGKQYRVSQGVTLDVERLDGDAGAKLTLDRVLAVSDGSALTVGTPAVSGAKVSASIVKQFRGAKVIAFRKKKRKGYHKKQGHRQDLTQIKIEGISHGA